MAALVSVFGCPFDPEIGEGRLAMKRAYAALAKAGLPTDVPLDPANVLKPYILDLPGVADGGTISVPEWARPAPAIDDPHALTAANSLRELRAGEARTVAEKVRKHIDACTGRLPLMIGIDHAASGGAIEALAARHGVANLVVVVLDSHLDAVPGSLRQGLLTYARENPAEFGTIGFDHADDPEPPAYDCGSFLFELIRREVVLPQNLFVFGCGDLPHPALRALPDTRVQNYLAHFDALLARGVRVIAREAILATDCMNALVGSVLGSTRNSAAYLSVDMDVGAHAAFSGVRFLDREGLPTQCLFALFEAVLIELMSRGNRLVGFDLTEFDFYRAGAIISGNRDTTYDCALRLVEMVVDRLVTTQGRTQWDG